MTSSVHKILEHSNDVLKAAVGIKSVIEELAADPNIQLSVLKMTYLFSRLMGPMQSPPSKAQSPKASSTEAPSTEPPVAETAQTPVSETAQTPVAETASTSPIETPVSEAPSTELEVAQMPS